MRRLGKDEQADFVLVNTCSVTDVADHKCRQVIHRLVRQHPDAFVVVTGCYAQLEAETVSQIEGVDLVLGSNEKASLVQFLPMPGVGQSLKGSPFRKCERQRISNRLRPVALVAIVRAIS